MVLAAPEAVCECHLLTPAMGKQSRTHWSPHCSSGSASAPHHTERKPVNLPHNVMCSLRQVFSPVIPAYCLPLGAHNCTIMYPLYAVIAL